eukprot:10368542-Karenia_brevis.AAC.1
MIWDLSAMHHGVLCLQEVAAWPSGDEAVIDGWTMVHQPDCPAALLIPSVLSFGIRWTGVAGSHACAVVGDSGFISSYLPDIQK